MRLFLQIMGVMCFSLTLSSGCQSSSSSDPIDLSLFDTTKVDISTTAKDLYSDQSSATVDGPMETALGVDSFIDQPCGYTQAIQYVDSAVNGTIPCGQGDGTCISGEIDFIQDLYTIEIGDIGEAYLFGSPNGPPLMIFRKTTPPSKMGYKIPNISDAITSACITFEVGGRLDKGGNNQGGPGGPEDPVLAPSNRARINLTKGAQLNHINFPIK